MKRTILFITIIIFGLVLALPSLAAPAQVGGVKVTKIRSTVAKVSWNEVSGANKYIVKVRKPNGQLVTTKKVTRNSVEINSLKKKTNYRVKVRAKNSSGDRGPWSRVKKFKTKSWRYYYNKTYGFNLKFPKAWKNFKAEKATIDYGEYGRNDIGELKTVSFKLPTTDTTNYPSGYATIFAIGAYTHNQWDLFQEFPIPPGDSIGETDDYIFGWNYQQSYPYELFPRHEEVEEIIDETFKLY